MSMHKVPLTKLEYSGLEKHGLALDQPSQLSDCFRLGVQWALKSKQNMDAQLINWVIKHNARISSLGDSHWVTWYTLAGKKIKTNSISGNAYDALAQVMNTSSSINQNEPPKDSENIKYITTELWASDVKDKGTLFSRVKSALDQIGVGIEVLGSHEMNLIEDTNSSVYQSGINISGNTPETPPEETRKYTLAVEVPEYNRYHVEVVARSYQSAVNKLRMEGIGAGEYEIDEWGVGCINEENKGENIVIEEPLADNGNFPVFVVMADEHNKLHHLKVDENFVIPSQMAGFLRGEIIDAIKNKLSNKPIKQGHLGLTVFTLEEYQKFVGIS